MFVILKFSYRYLIILLYHRYSPSVLVLFVLRPENCCKADRTIQQKQTLNQEVRRFLRYEAPESAPLTKTGHLSTDRKLKRTPIRENTNK